MATYPGPVSACRKVCEDSIIVQDTTSGVLIVYQTPVVEGAGNLGFSDFTMYETFPGGTLV